MGSRARAEHSDSERVRRWRLALIDDLGADLRQCIRWMHSSDAEGLVIVLRSMRRCAVPERTQQGTTLYWHALTMYKRGGSPELSHAVCGELPAPIPT